MTCSERLGQRGRWTRRSLRSSPCRRSCRGGFAALDPDESLDENRLTDLYSYPDDLQSCWVRGNMITSLDGGATDDGKAGRTRRPRRPRGVRAHAPTRRRHPGRCGHRPDRELLGRTVQPRAAPGPPAPRPGRGAADRRRHRQRRARPRREALHPHRGAAADPHRCRGGRRRPPAGSDRSARSSTRRVADPDRVDAATVLQILADRKLVAGARRGRPAVPRLADRARSARRAVPDRRTAAGRRGAPRIATGPGQVHTPMRRSHLLTDDAGYLYARYVKGA